MKRCEHCGQPKHANGHRLCPTCNDDIAIARATGALICQCRLPFGPHGDECARCRKLVHRPLAS